ncbi:MAG: hypothetical protein A2146_08940 [Actinobacteria bacterium RBG_16_67_10]|nr:MAG: hypothetical protein A2146_08940 [Actinobacteria bacterium RBG_16_67_10]
MIAFGGGVLAAENDHHEANFLLHTSFLDEDEQVVSIYLSIRPTGSEFSNYFSVSRYSPDYSSGYDCGTWGLDALMPRVQFQGQSVRVSGVFDSDASAMLSCFGDVPTAVLSFDLTFTPDALTHSHGRIITSIVGENASETFTLDVWESYSGATVSGEFDGVAVDTEVFWISLRYGDYPAWD